MEEIKNNLLTTFQKLYGEEASAFYFSPGRVNLIGEHIDYNGGYVFPCAITQGTYGLVKLRDDQLVNCYSLNFEDKGVIQFSLDQLVYDKEDSWANYVKGVIKFVGELGHEIDRGFDLVVYGNIPNGAGLSSSASLELLIGVILENEFNLDVTRIDLIKVGQRVENDFLGLKTGIMDQFAIGMGRADQAIYLNVNTLDYDLVPAVFGDYAILIMNTNKRRELTDSKYNQRRQECEDALAQLQQELEIKTLCDLDIPTFEAHKDLITDPVLYARAKHAVYENVRTQEAKKALTDGQLERFGELLNESHISLRDDYEVTGKELDKIVELAWDMDSVLGARMTGAGMGGCAIALVNSNDIDEAIKTIGAAYEQEIGYPASFYVAHVGDGTKKLS